VEIKPGNEAKIQTDNKLYKYNCDEGWELKSHNLKFSYEMISGPPNAELFATIACYNPTWTQYNGTGINFTVEINNAPSGYYEFHFGVDTSSSAIIHHKYFIDDVLYSEGEQTASDVFGSFTINCCTSPSAFFRDFDVETNQVGYLGCNNLIYLNIKPDFDKNICFAGNDIWDPNKPITVTIEDTMGYIKFYDKITKKFVGQTLVNDYNSINTNYIIYGDLPVGADPQTTNIRFEWYDSVKTKLSENFTPPGKFSFYNDTMKYKDKNLMSFGYSCFPIDPDHPENNTLSLRIIKGNEYVSFGKYWTEENVGDNLSIRFDSLEYYALVNDVLKDTTTTAIVEAEINRLVQTDMVYIVPPEFKVTIVPSTLAPGDTAEVILRKRIADGIYAEFPEGQLFYPDLLEGLDYAKLLWEGEQQTSFYEIPEGFKLVAADSINADSVKVVLRVGTYINDEVPAASKRKNLDAPLLNARSKSIDKEALPINEKDKIKKKSIGNKPALIGIGGGGGEYVETFADAFIQKEDCENAPKCTNEPKLPEMDVKEINCDNGIDKQKQEIISNCIGTWGFFEPSWDGPLFDSIFTEPCFYNGTWQFNYMTNPLWLNAYVVFCPDCIQKDGILKNKTDVWRIPEDKLCDAMADFNAQRYYGANVTYKIKEATMIHERLHKNDFFAAKSKTLYKYPKDGEKKYNSLLVNTGWDCSKFRNFDETIKEMQIYWTEKVEEFKDDLRSVFNYNTCSNDIDKHKQYEKGLWNNKLEIQNKIKDYKDELIKRIKSINKNRPENLKIRCK
jgi:hypothetical protein